MNCTVPLIPTPERAYRRHDHARHARGHPGNERIAVVATGGLRTSRAAVRYFWLHEEFDRWFLDLSPRPRDVAPRVHVERMEEAGSGGTAELPPGSW
jgi:protocatechuate 4,5-dioxygenase beta chain